MRHDDASKAPEPARPNESDSAKQDSPGGGSGDKAARKLADRQGQRFGQPGAEKRG